MTEIPDIPLENYELPEEEDVSIKDESGGCTKYAFIGAGQGGSRIAEAFYKLGYKKTICVNTAEHDLNTIDIPVEQKLHYDIGTSGAGKNPEVGEAAAVKYQQATYDKMKQIFGTDVQRILISAGCGGGTGAASTLVLLDLARKYLAYIGNKDPKKHAGAIVTLPTTGEALSPVIANNAKLQAERLAMYAEQGEISPLLFVDNDKIQKLYPKLTVKEFWPTVNTTIAGLFHTFNVIATQNSQYTTFDPADYNTVLSSGGCMIMGLTNIRNYATETDISSALRNNLTKTLLADGFDLSTAKVAASIVIGGDELFATVPGLQNAINYGFDCIANLCEKATVHRGVYETSKQKLSVYTLIGGLSAPTERIDAITRNVSQRTRLYGE